MIYSGAVAGFLHTSSWKKDGRHLNTGVIALQHDQQHGRAALIIHWAALLRKQEGPAEAMDAYAWHMVACSGRAGLRFYLH